MSARSTKWIQAGLLALPLYGLLTIWSTWEPQPDQNVDTEAWAQFVSSSSYVINHTVGAVGGAVVAIFGVVALGAYLANGRAGRMALWGMVMAVVGHALGIAIGAISAFATPAIGRLYLAGTTDVMQMEFPAALTPTFMVALVLMFVGNVLLGVAVWRSDTLPKWSGALWVASALVFYILGAAAGMATTGSSLPTQPIGAALMVVGGAWIAWSAFRSRSL